MTRIKRWKLGQIGDANRQKSKSKKSCLQNTGLPEDRIFKTHSAGISKVMEMQEIRKQLAVIGAGPAGVCAALAAARLGIETVLLGNRPVLGGNSSSEIRVWTRGATGAGSLFAEEMGVWGRLKLENFYRNPDGNPLFWSETLLDAVMSQRNLTFFLNTEVFELAMNGGRIGYIEGVQQGAERRLRVCADCFIDATGDGTLGAEAGIPFYVGDRRVEPTDGPQLPGAQLQGSSILYYTRREEHPVRFIPPNYAYDMEKIEQMLGRGGRIVNEQLSGSDCWWFEYGGVRNTIGDAQDIALELKRLVLGVWNYIKNSGKFDADCYTLDWLGSLPGKRESRRMETEYRLRGEDLLGARRFPDGAFYGGWYMDYHPAGGMHDAHEENCVQIPVNVYQVPLRTLYNRQVPNLIFAGRNIGTERDAFVSTRIMNTCALSGQAAGTLAAVCVRLGKSPAELDCAEVSGVRETLLREDMFIPGVRSEDGANLAGRAAAAASSHHSGACGPRAGSYSLGEGGFVTFPAVEGGRVAFTVTCDRPVELRARAHRSMLPSRLRPGEAAGDAVWKLEKGEHRLDYSVPPGMGGAFCTLVFENAPGAELGLARPGRTGFVCGRASRSEYCEPMLAYEGDAGLYVPAQAINGYARPWGGPNQWCAAPGDESPWLELRWETPVELSEVRLYLDPELSMELPSSHTRQWDESHHFTAREEMPAQLVRDLRIQVRGEDGALETVFTQKDNCQRLLVAQLPRPVRACALRVCADAAWGDRSPAVYEVRAYGPAEA